MIIEWLWKAAKSPRVLLIATLLTAISFLAIGLGGIVRDAAKSLLLPAALIGSLVGWQLGSTIPKNWIAWTTIVISGIALIFIRIGEFYNPFFRLLATLPQWLQQTKAWVYYRAPVDFSAQANILAEMAEGFLALTSRLWLWLYGTWLGVIVNDPAARALVWGLGIWFLSTWAGWALARRKNALLALAPALAVLAIVNDYAASGGGNLLGMLVCLFVLLGIGKYESNIYNWLKNKVDYSDSIPMDTGIALVLAIIPLTVLAWFSPSISVRDIAETLRDLTSNDSQVAESLGIPPAPAQNSSAVKTGGTALPRSHLLGMEPELGKTVVFTVSTGEINPIPYMTDSVPIPRHYWRQLTYDVYTGYGWTTSDLQDKTYASNQVILEQPQFYKTLTQTVTRRQAGDDNLYYAGVLASANAPVTIAWRTLPNTASNLPILAADMFGGLVRSNPYKAVSYEPQFSAEQLRSAPAIYPPEISARYLQLPTMPERVLALARDLTATAPTPFERALAIQNYLRSTYPYTLEVPAPPTGKDVADYFLFELQKGYCDYYATSMAVLARAAGLPARLVMGYASGTYDTSSATYIVTESNAHSWVEIYFPTLGWVEFEPTATYPAPTLLDIDAIQSTPGLPASSQASPTFGGIVRRLPQIMLIFIAPFLVVIFAAFIWQNIEFLIYLRMPGQQAITKLYQGLEKLGNTVAGSSETKETPYEFSTRLVKYLQLAKPSKNGAYLKPAQMEIEQITRVYVKATFSPILPPAKDIQQIIKLWGKLRWRLGLLWAASKMMRKHSKLK